MNNKPLGHKSYGHIPHIIGSRMGPADKHCELGQQRIVLEKTRDRYDLIIVQEKLDGSNVSIARIGDELCFLSRAGYTASSSRYEQHHLFANWASGQSNRFFELLKDGERLCGEWLAQAHGTKYNLPHEPFVPFDIIRGHDERITYHDFLLRVLPLGFTVPRLIHIGQPLPLKEVIKRLEPSGHGAVDKVEGAVFRCERNCKVDFMCKYVRPEKEDGIYLPEVSGVSAVWNWKP